MQRSCGAIGIAIFAAAGAGVGARGDVIDDFPTNPLTDNAVLKLGPGAADAATRFSYNSAAGTLTAHYDSSAPTVKLVFPLGRHFTQDSSFVMTTTFKILSNGFESPASFGAEAPSFGLINSATTGNARASTGYYDSNFNFAEVAPGTAYDIMTFDYFPTQDNTYGGNSVNLTTIQGAQAGASFNSRYYFNPAGYDNFANATLPFDQFITVTLAYSAATHRASLDWGTGSMTPNLAGAVFDVDSFALTLWQDPNLAPEAPAVASGDPVGGDVVFDSFSVQAVPEAGSALLLGLGVLGLLARRARER